MLLEERSSSSDTNLICDEEFLEYNCTTVYSPTGTGSLIWEVTFPGQTAVVITYTSDEFLDALRLFSNNIATTLRQFTVGQYIGSTLTITASSSLPLIGTEVKCSAGGLPPTAIDIQHVILLEGMLWNLAWKFSYNYVDYGPDDKITLITANYGDRQSTNFYSSLSSIAACWFQSIKKICYF